MRNLISRLTMKRVICIFIDNISGKSVYTYVDKYGDEWMSNYPFYYWSFRSKK